jgi:hypothetical protein
VRKHFVEARSAVLIALCSGVQLYVCFPLSPELQEMQFTSTSQHLGLCRSKVLPCPFDPEPSLVSSGEGAAGPREGDRPQGAREKGRGAVASTWSVVCFG